MLKQRLQAKLDLRGKQSLTRSRQSIRAGQGSTIHIQNKVAVSFCSNDYLGLSKHPAVIAAFQQGVNVYGVGMGGSPVVSGTRDIHLAFEEAFADFTQRDSALLFPTGYMANLGVLTALSNKDDETEQKFKMMLHA